MKHRYNSLPAKIFFNQLEVYQFAACRQTQIQDSARDSALQDKISPLVTFYVANFSSELVLTRAWLVLNTSSMGPL